MKTAIIVLIVLFIVFIVLSITVSTIKDQTVSTLNNQITTLTNENIGLKATSNLKSFETKKALERFLSEATTPLKTDSKTYPSESCINLMREAKEKGYWLGITAINTTNENYYDAMKRDRMGAVDVQWHIFNVAIVGDSDLYLVDSQDISNCFFIISINGDFSDYNKAPESNISNLKLH
jgi:hypothetical protein